MRILVLCVGKLKEDWQRAGCAEYLKRLSRFAAVEVREVSDQPEGAKPSEATMRAAMEKEGEALLRQIRPEDRVVALAIQGEAFDSPAFAKRVGSWQTDGRRVVLVIGGSLGLSPAVLRRADEKLSFSKLTFPHPLMRVILLEQLYRAMKILSGERYHK
ncbi:MAG: 23S rRNA (pseudouridine(1915)-N(3))-methyltransferase RlmH [Clostridia bacterium]|nr:23S rRNA (pseudouridine(1915)-N(3))-methyltransferase RlmH [Clostridia bacterium]